MEFQLIDRVIKERLAWVLLKNDPYQLDLHVFSGVHLTFLIPPVNFMTLVAQVFCSFLHQFSRQTLFVIEQLLSYQLHSHLFQIFEKVLQNPTLITITHSDHQQL